MNIKTRIIKFRQDLLFYVYKEKKNLMIWLRLWFIARHIVDVEWSWFADIKQLSKYSKLQSSYIARICNQSIFFYSIENNKVNYVSENRVCKKLWLIHRLWRIRGEVYSNKFIKQFESDKLFKGFILKCFVESPGCKRSKFKETKGTIGYWFISSYFNISRTTAINNIKCSLAKPVKNIIVHLDIVFSNKKEFGPWLVNNMQNVVGWIRVSDQPGSFLIKKIKVGKYCLRQQLPNKYKFTGAFLTRTRLYRGLKRLYFKVINPRPHWKGAL